MDGTRMGSRSSTRHGPASVFSGPVRRWKKAWAPISSSNTSSAVSSRVLLYKWVPLTPGAKDEASEEPTVRSVRYLPVSIVLAQRKEASRRAAEEVEAASQQSADTNGEPIVQAEVSDHPMDSTDLKGADSSRASEEQGRLVDGQNITDSGDRSNKSEGPSTGADTSVDVEMQDQAQDVRLSEVPSGVDVEEDAQVPSDSSVGSEGEG